MYIFGKKAAAKKTILGSNTPPKEPANHSGIAWFLLVNSNLPTRADLKINVQV